MNNLYNASKHRRSAIGVGVAIGIGIERENAIRPMPFVHEKLDA
jgi:hypothetical protein